MFDLDMQRLTEIDLEWRDIDQSYRLEPYNAPINLASERSKMLAAFEGGETYNPTFEYAVPPEFPIGRIHQFIHSLQPADSVLEGIYFSLAQQELMAIRTVLTHAPNEITGYTCLAHGIPDSELTALAQSILASDQKDTQGDADIEDLSADQVAAEMRVMLETLGLDDWTALTYSPMNAKMAVSQKDRQVKVRENASFSRSDLARLLVHEIGVHVLRAVNGSKQPLTIFSRGLPGYVATEEGLAVFSEEKAGVIAVNTMRKYAARVIAAGVALGHSFNDVFYSIATEVGPETAFDIAARAKRGFRGTAELGAHTKDIVYLMGYRNVSQHLKAHPEDYDILFTGKFGLHDLDVVKSLVGNGTLHHATLMPTHL